MLLLREERLFKVFLPGIFTCPVPLNTFRGEKSIILSIRGTEPVSSKMKMALLKILTKAGIRGPQKGPRVARANNQPDPMFKQHQLCLVSRMINQLFQRHGKPLPVPGRL